METYRLTAGAEILRGSDGATIPPDPANTDYIAYQAWVAAGNTPDPGPVGASDDTTFADDPWHF